MSFAKTVPKGLKWIECKRGILGKNFLMRYIPEQDPMQEALEKNKKTTYFKLTLPNMGMSSRWQYGHPGLPAVFTAWHLVIRACKQMGLDTSFAKATTTLESATIDVELTKGEYVQQSCNSKKTRSNVPRAEILMVLCLLWPWPR